MADASEVLMVLVERDRTGRVGNVEVYEPGVAPPSWLADYLPHDIRLRQVKDPRDEVKETEDLFSEEDWIAWEKGAGWYALEGGPEDGESVRGKDSVPDGYKMREAD